jgi:hypothetical protein
MCNRLPAVVAAITVFSLAAVEATSAQEVVTRSQAFRNGFATCRAIGQVALAYSALYGVTGCVVEESISARSDDHVCATVKKVTFKLIRKGHHYRRVE